MDQFLIKLGQRIEKLSWPVVVIAFSTIIFLRCGIFVNDAGPWYKSTGEALTTSSWGYQTFPQWLNLSPFGFSVLWAFVALLDLVFITLIASRIRGLPNGRIWSRYLLIGIAATSIPVVVLMNASTYDSLTLLGVLIIVYSRRWPGVAIGAFVLASGNPEAALIASCCVLILVICSRWRSLLNIGLWVLVASLGTLLFTNIFNTIDKSRSGQFIINIPASVKGFATWFPLATYSLLGAASLIVLALVIVARPKEKYAILAAIVLIPMLITVLTLDGTRVFVVVSSLPLLLVMREYAHTQATRESLTDSFAIDQFRWLGILALWLILTPTFYWRGDYDSIWKPMSWAINCVLNKQIVCGVEMH